MIEYWPTVKSIALCSISALDFAVSLSKEIKECERKFAHVWEKPEEKKMNKEEARRAAEKASIEMLNDGWTVRPIVDGGTQFDVSFQKENDSIGRIFPYTPEPPPIKKGVLCVGETCSSKKMVFGRSAGNVDRDGDLMLETSDFTVGSYEERTLPVRNPRPVTPADLVRWGWESGEFRCAYCKHRDLGVTISPCSDCARISQSTNFEPKQ